MEVKDLHAWISQHFWTKQGVAHWARQQFAPLIHTHGSSREGGQLTTASLSDHVQGTWTPAIVSDATITYSNQSGHYTRTGRRVTAWGLITVNTISGGTGAINLVVTVPIACSTGLNYYGSGVMKGKASVIELLSGFPTHAYAYGHDGVTIKLSEVTNGSSYNYTITYLVD